MGHVSVFAALAFLPSAMSFLLRSTSPMESGYGVDECKGEEDCLPQGTVEECEAAVGAKATNVRDYKDEDECETTSTKALCFASAGLNPAKKGDEDHYHEEAWKAFPKGGIEGLNFYVALKNAHCKYCPSVGYWPEAERSTMIFCDGQVEVSEALLKHCVATGILLFQDAVLYRPFGEGVKMYKTYMNNHGWEVELRKTTTNFFEGDTFEKYLVQAAFGEESWGAQDMGTEFTPEEGDTGKPTRFAFKYDGDRNIFCEKCVAETLQVTSPSYKDLVVRCIRTGVGKHDIRGRLCHLWCQPPPGNMKFGDKCVPRKRCNGKRIARATSLARRMVRRLFGRARPAQ